MRAAAKGEQGKAKKKAVKPLANRSRHDFICAMLFPREGYHWAADIAAVNTLTA